jgi:hypothetical protein
MGAGQPQNGERACRGRIDNDEAGSQASPLPPSDETESGQCVGQIEQQEQYRRNKNLLNQQIQEIQIQSNLPTSFHQQDRIQAFESPSLWWRLYDPTTAP